ncbi:PREDICTED: uncharacterized protein LOC109580550 [Amphimedon queenslandica]|uniref:Uncharacterized protein n=1 Tax=Amphimedon queenslandica TaxID=400682 RepID=A0A1X7VW90_AMPQE|nr:PREDICTED: uncharacterized protein LOC109580550 [Amphimedon queenslandica]|eukprot:XP_019849413.1 PREDICTED: uncharacterized protein LOC109580550 [Amphimedon queenslandica]
MGSSPRSVYLGLSLILLTCFIIAVQGQYPTRHFLQRPLPPPRRLDSEFHQSSLTHIKVTSNIPVRSRSGLRPPSRRPQPARELNYIQNRRPYDNNRRPYDNNRRPYDTNRRPYDTIRRPYDTNRHHPQNPFQRHSHSHDQRPYLPRPPVHVGPYPTVRGRVYPLPPPVPAPYTTIRRCNRNQQCPSGKTFDYNQCKCVCIVQVTTCPGAMNYNSDTCKCECSSRLVCNQYQRRNDAQCRCDPIHSPPHPPTTTVTTSSCPATSRYLCSPRQILNLRTCQCQCPRFSANRCSSLQVLDQRTCQCVCRNRSGRCPYGKIMNRNTCQCECPLVLTIRCYYPRRMDPNTCNCR